MLSYKKVQFDFFIKLQYNNQDIAKGQKNEIFLKPKKFKYIKREKK